MKIFTIKTLIYVLMLHHVGYVDTRAKAYYDSTLS